MSDLKKLINIEAAIAEFGDPVYGFFRQHVAYSAGRKRGQGCHYVSCESIEIPEQEYRDNVEASKEQERLRFFSHARSPFTKSYWRYEKRVVKPGWPQAIKALIEQMETA